MLTIIFCLHISLSCRVQVLTSCSRAGDRSVCKSNNNKKGFFFLLNLNWRKIPEWFYVTCVYKKRKNKRILYGFTDKNKLESASYKNPCLYSGVSQGKSSFYFWDLQQTRKRHKNCRTFLIKKLSKHNNNRYIHGKHQKVSQRV